MEIKISNYNFLMELKIELANKFNLEVFKFRTHFFLLKKLYHLYEIENHPTEIQFHLFVTFRNLAISLKH